MSEEQNPYQAPQKDDVIKAFSSENMIRRGFLMVIFSALFFGAAGASVGLALGALAPDYYRAVFRLTSDQSPIQLGVGLGLTQGLIAGVVVACVVVLAAAWFKSRVKEGVLRQLDRSE